MPLLGTRPQEVQDSLGANIPHDWECLKSLPMQSNSVLKSICPKRGDQIGYSRKKGIKINLRSAKHCGSSGN